MHSLRMKFVDSNAHTRWTDKLGLAIKMLWPTICIKNRTNIYSYAFTYMHSKCQAEKNEKKYTHIFGIHFYCHAKRMKKKYYFFCMAFCCALVFVILLILVLTFVFRNFFSTISCFCLDSLHQENLNDLSIYYKRKEK